jgi:hypothetical protein
VRHAAYVALADGRDRFACLSTAFDMLGWTVREHRQVTGHNPVWGLERDERARHLAWLHLPGFPETPGRIALDHRWDPRLLCALSRVSGQVAAEAFYDRHTFDHGFAVAYAGVRITERCGGFGITGRLDSADGEAGISEFMSFVEAAAGYNWLLMLGDEEPEGELLTFEPTPAAPDMPANSPTLPEISRILIADAPADRFEPPDGWGWTTDEPYGAPYIALQRQGPVDDALAHQLADLGELLAVNVKDGGDVRWLHLGAGHDETGDGNGWRDLLATWPRLAPHLLLPPREINWPSVEPVQPR